MGAVTETEAAELARLTSKAYVQAVAYYRESGHSPDEADALARAPLTHLADAPSHEVGWFALNTLLDSAPEQAVAIWERVKRDAAHYVESGSQVAEALAYDTPWQRAQFCVIQKAFYDEWQPGGGVERALLDTIAHAYCAYFYWAGQVQQRTMSDPLETPTERSRRRSGEWVAPRLTTADAIEQAAQMADRFNRVMLRSLRALRDLRRSNVLINVMPGGQVNIGQQQVNTARLDVSDESML
jgi:hypothetical protein